VNGLTVVACPECGDVSFADAGGIVAPRMGIGRLFGQYDLVASLPALGAPARTVLLYRPPTATARRALAAFPAHVWLEGDEGLWISHDGEHLLIAHNAPWITHDLLDGA
jgi:hypothetical protein